jgi:hypothetical protein
MMNLPAMLRRGQRQLSPCKGCILGPAFFMLSRLLNFDPLKVLQLVLQNVLIDQLICASLAEY